MYSYVIIDDEELIRKGTVKKLEILKDQVQCIGEAANGKSGIKLIDQLHPDFVILDMQMPEMDGMELLPYLAEHYPDLQLIVISGYRDFDYIKQAISSNALEYLLKPFSKETIKEVVLKAIARIEDRSSIQNQIRSTEQEKEQVQYEYDLQVIKNLILGYQTDETRLTSQKLNYLCENHDLCLLAFECTKAVSANSMENILNELGFEDLMLYFQSPSSESLGLLLLFVPQHDPIHSGRVIEQTLDALTPPLSELDVFITVGISAPHSSILELSSAYTEAVSALDHQLICEDAPFFYYYDGEEDTHAISWDREDEFLFRIEAGMDTEVKSLIREMFAFYTSLPDCTLADVKYHCYTLSDQCRQILDSYIHTTETLKSSASMQNVVNHLFSLHDLMDYYTQFFLNLTNMIKPNSVYAIDDVIEKIQIYIRRNYQKDLSQEYLSSLFYINRSYLSTLFKERTGQKFVDYLNNVRITKSKELLSQTDKKMYQIAKSVGYDNVKYFFRIFKKLTGMTPEEYRMKNTA